MRGRKTGRELQDLWLRKSVARLVHLRQREVILDIALIALIIGLAGFETFHSNSLRALLVRAQSWDNSAGSSWAVGVVVPQGASIERNGSANWQLTNNVTVLLRIPEINSTDKTIYLILSLMTVNNTILQVATGLYHNSSTWGTYAMYIQNPLSIPQLYQLVFSSSSPKILPGELVAILLYMSDSCWNFKVDDINTSSSSHSSFGKALSSPIAAGDQEVFALESYSSNRTVFENMSNLTLYSVSLDGKRLTSGFYLFGDWDGVHDPLFVVGGATPPNFLSVRISDEGRTVWNFKDSWTTVSYAFPVDVNLFYSTLAAIAAAGLALTTVLVIRRKRQPANGTVRNEKNY